MARMASFWESQVRFSSKFRYDLMTPEKLKRIAEHVLEGKNLYQMDFEEPNLTAEEKLALVDMAIKRYPFPETPSEHSEDS